MNLYYLGGFGVLAVVTFLVLRHLRFGYLVAAIGALVYTFLPYHFVHGEGHLYRSTYYSVPLACLLLVWAQSWRSRFLVDPDPPPGVRLRHNLRLQAGRRRAGHLRRGRRHRDDDHGVRRHAARQRRAGVGHPVEGTGAAPGERCDGGRDLRHLRLFTLPTFNYYLDHGTNRQAARRLVTESELYGLKLSRLVTPQGGHRFKPLSDLGAKAQENSQVPSEGGQALGILGTAGFLGALYGALANGMRRTSRSSGSPPTRRSRRTLGRRRSLITVLAVLFGTIGGFSILMSMAGFSQVRVWDRICMIIAFFAL